MYSGYERCRCNDKIASIHDMRRSFRATVRAIRNKKTSIYTIHESNLFMSNRSFDSVPLGTDGPITTAEL